MLHLVTTLEVGNKTGQRPTSSSDFWKVVVQLSLCEAQTWVCCDSLVCQSAQWMSVAMTFLMLILEDILESSLLWSFVFSLWHLLRSYLLPQIRVWHCVVHVPSQALI